MIRLSEAIARANCMKEVSAVPLLECLLMFTQITPAFVREAYSLLKQSIIHVEKDDVEMDEEDGDEDDRPDDPMDEDRPAPTQSSPTRQQGSPAAQLVPSSAPQEKPKKKKLVISYDRYQTISQMVILHLQDAERSTGSGVRKEDVKAWYLEQREADITSTAELEEEQILIDKVLAKLVKVCFLNRTACSG